MLTPKNEIDARIARLQAGLQQAGLDGALIIHHTNLFYYSGTSQNGHLYVPKFGEPILMVRKSFHRARQESCLAQIVELKSLKKIPEVIEQTGRLPASLALELDVVPVNTFQLYQRAFIKTELADGSEIFRRIRLIKSDYEIDRLRQACEVIDQVFSEAPGMLKEGRTEIELASLFEAAMRKRGFAGGSRMRAFNQDFYLGNITSGASAAVGSYFDGPVGGMGMGPANNPHGAGPKPIRKNEIVYIDYTCVVNGYTADVARMFVLGKVDAHLERAHRLALDIQARLKQIARPGTECRLLYHEAQRLAQERGLAGHFMGMGENQVKFVGHGVGLELDEQPVFADRVTSKLEPGMTFALEPKFVFEDGAVGIENTFALRDDGLQQLSLADESIIAV